MNSPIPLRVMKSTASISIKLLDILNSERFFSVDLLPLTFS